MVKYVKYKKVEIYDPYESEKYENHFYIVENIPIKETENLFNELFAEGCSCRGTCTLPTCTCLKRRGIIYNLIDNDETAEALTNKNFILNRSKSYHGVYECTPNCDCKNFCGNRLVQFGPRENLIIKECPGKGKGLFTTENIQKGQFICEYAGEIVTRHEALTRLKKNEENNLPNYILCVREFFGMKQQLTIIDPTHFGNIGRYINHSCKPNCDIIAVKTRNTIPQLCVFATVDIEEGNEITFSYGESGVDQEGKKLTPCLCGENNCSKWLPYFPEL